MAAKKKDPLFMKGLRVRTEVLGAEHVKRRTQKPNEYAWPFEEFTTKAAWGLSGRVRAFAQVPQPVNLGMLTALGQPQELRLHIRAALRNGLTRTEIVEALLHTSVYCGIPKCSEARRAMLEVFEQVDADKSAPKRTRRTASR